MRFSTLLALVAVAQVADANGQALPFNTGRRVQVTYDCFAVRTDAALSVDGCASFDGSLIDVDGGVLVLDNGSGVIARIPASSTRSMRVLLGHETQWRKGTLFGGLAGLFVGGAWASTTWKPCVNTGMLSCLFYPSKGEATAMGMVGGSLLGMGIGALVGMSFTAERWENVPLRHLRAGISPGRDGGVGLQLSMTF